MASGPFIHRFTRDLRLEDNAGLAAAAARGDVLPVLAVDEKLGERLRASPRRAVFYCAAVRALDAELRARGSRLLVRRGPAERVVAEVARATGAAGVSWSVAYDGAEAQSDRAAQSALEERGLAALLVHDAPAIAPEESAAARSVAGLGYRAFAPYFESWRELPVASYELPLWLRFGEGPISSEPLPAPAEFGADEANDRCDPASARTLLERFLRDGASRYASAARVPSAEATSRLAPHLSFGTISPRTVCRAVRERLADPFSIAEERASLRAYLRALARRDFFLQLAWFHPETSECALQERMREFTWERTHPALDAWCQGRTGYPLVDAGLRQLRATGWMHPHVRAVAASFLCFDLGVDWRVGRAVWDRWLIEDDPALATGNWQWIAGVGADMAQYPRIYNPERQRRSSDPSGDYVREWVPELRHVPLDEWFARTSSSPQLGLDLFGEDAYPPAVVDHEQAATAFLNRYRAFASP